jgi:uncharacterized membrane protein
MKANRDHKTTVTEGKEPVRLISLSDGLFATVLTLLVLDLRIPEALNVYGGNVSTFVKWLGPHLFSYLLTFLVAGTYWLAHHRNFDLVVHYDQGLLSYNLVFLLFIGLLPFTTAGISVGSYLSGDFRFHWSIYAANILLAGVMLGLTWAYAVSHHLMTTEMTRQQIRYIAARHLVTPAAFLLSILTECFFPQFFLGPYTLLVIPLGLWGVERKFAPVDPHRPSPSLSWSELLWRAGNTLPWILIMGLAIWATNL